ncbi:TauD/TfdA family dioxygenase [Actinacidiphila rubida]|uniref:Taurine catabolism dioxygenase TauD, TfdA family n=1 Tax=Actinacidiphila rubida TaxID=310780 RepID=A0A1H8K9B7_9ACTN|nr:TauD/TfdA family dioxygenase [Actinacidiphila rubida]SEN89612.1 Taurine catabolism dioxygenase TauD, TfdA family [Actinacidiphila rubida]
MSVVPAHGIAEVTSAVDKELASSGLVLFTGLGGRFTELLALYRSFTTPAPHRDSDARGVTRIAAVRADDGAYRGFSRMALPLHTDSASAPHPPDWILLFCESAGTGGGDFLLADGVAAALQLRDVRPDMFGRLLTAPVMVTGSATPRTPLYRRADHTIGVRYRTRDPARTPERTGTDAEHLVAYNSALRSIRSRIPCEGGSGYILDNSRWLHGRTRYSGDRVVLRVLGGAR